MVGDNEKIEVWCEMHGKSKHVGSLTRSAGGYRFGYDPDYSGNRISTTLPINPHPFSEDVTKLYFGNLLPEGSNRDGLQRIAKLSSDEYLAALALLNDEAIGALQFSTGDHIPGTGRNYEPIDEGMLAGLSRQPEDTASRTMLRTRLSLTGAMAKIGIYRDPDTQRLYLPYGGAASTHIVKAPNHARFPGETINEALCLRSATAIGFDAAECKLLDTGAEDPLIMVERYDRILDGDNDIADGLPIPKRLHQEDFCQALAIPEKYEPTGVSYLNLIAAKLDSTIPYSYGERNLLFEMTYYDYLIGNCDNHLKNYSILYDEDWNPVGLAPLYDTVSTVLYPNLYTEMGVSFGGSRRIGDADAGMLRDAAGRCGIDVGLAIENINDMAERAADALSDSAAILVAEGYGQAEKIADRIISGVRERDTAARKEPRSRAISIASRSMERKTRKI